MQNNVQTIDRMVKKMLNDIADSELYEWPPRCAAICYQPVRPKRDAKEFSSKHRVDDSICGAAPE